MTDHCKTCLSLARALRRWVASGAVGPSLDPRQVLDEWLAEREPKVEASAPKPSIPPDFDPYTKGWLNDEFERRKKIEGTPEHAATRDPPTADATAGLFLTEAVDYLTRLVIEVSPGIVPCKGIMGLCTQVDNLLTERSVDDPAAGRATLLAEIEAAGWRIVPKAPTETMLYELGLPRRYMAQGWERCLAAAPKWEDRT